jgi:hypothetical protein
MAKYSMLTKKKIVAATMVLHNYIREHSSGDVNFANCDLDSDFVPTIPDRYNKYVLLPYASYDSTFKASFLSMDAFHDIVVTPLSVVWH